MPNIKVAGVKTYRSKGNLYHYHRATGVRIDVDLATAPRASSRGCKNLTSSPPERRLFRL